MSLGSQDREVLMRPHDRMRRMALRAAAQGFYVFPVQSGGKTPAVERGTSWEDVATRDRSQLNAWWEHIGHNIGVSTGKSGLLVIDLDCGNGATPPAAWAEAGGGQEVLARLAAAAGEPYPGHTLTVTTASGGNHLYFRARQGVTRRTSRTRTRARRRPRTRGVFQTTEPRARSRGGRPRTHWGLPVYSVAIRDRVQSSPHVRRPSDR
jgi:hypothetical protein